MDKHQPIASLCVCAAIALAASLTACQVKTSDVVTIGRGNAVYRGQAKNGKPEGLGVLYLGDSIAYSGSWKQGRRQGEGWITDSLGRRIDGTFDHDTLVRGRRVEAGGTYTGGFDRRLLAHGYGSFRDTLGTYYEGQWKHGERAGFGFSSAHRYFRVGEWSNDRYRGERLNYNASRIYGIDISKYQHIRGKHRHGISWDRLRISHLGTLSKKSVSGNVDYKVTFIFIKSTEGSTLLNPYYSSDYAAAKAHGFDVGTYHYFTHLRSGAQQAQWFLSKSHFRKGDLPPVLDLEPLPSQIQKMGGVAAMWKRVRAWLGIVERRTGMKPILYISQTFVNRYLDAASDIKHNYPVWIARYGEYKPDVKLRIWQLAPDGRVRGIHGTVDINVFNGYQAEYNAWANEVKKQ